jgi:hypothetical protein
MTYIDPENDLSQTNKPIWRFVLNVVVVVMLLFILFQAGKWAYKASYINSSVKRMDQELALMKQKMKRVLEFYNYDYTDEILARLGGNQDVEYIAFNLTDIGPEGIDQLSKFPNLKGLLLYGGGRITNQAIPSLTKLPILEVLILKNTRVDDEGILLLKELASLINLELFWESYDGPILTDKALDHLAQFPHLKQIHLSGGWSSDDAVKKLKDKLPACSISQRSGLHSLFEPY